MNEASIVPIPSTYGVYPYRVPHQAEAVLCVRRTKTRRTPEADALLKLHRRPYTWLIRALVQGV